jgi:tripartite-type tricarboxylate transporter receptor subunit TctC
LVAHPSVPAASVKELLALARSRPDQLNFATAGSGSGPHLSAELFKSMTRVQMVHVPYKSGGPALIDLLGGQVSLMFPSMPAALPYVKAGKLRALGVTTSRRSSAAPDVPTISESGLPGYESDTWYGVLAPAGTSREILTLLNTEIVKSLQTPDMRERLSRLGLEPAGTTPDQFFAYLKAETAKWGKVINEAGIRAD